MSMNDYEYVIDAFHKVIFAKPFHKHDVKTVVDFAKSITINADNYKEYLGFDCAPVFNKTGALLETSEEELTDMADHPEKYVSLALWSKDNELLAFVAVQLQDIGDFLSDEKNITFRKEYEHKWDEWMMYKREGRMAFKGDLAIKAGTTYSGLREILYSLLCRELSRRSIVYCVTEVFHIIDCRDGDGVHEVNVFNKPSFVSQVDGGGAAYVGDYKSLSKCIGNDILITYYAKLLEYDVERLYNISTVRLDQKYIKVRYVE